MHKIVLAKLFLALSSIAILAAAGAYADRRSEPSAQPVHVAGAASGRWLVEPTTSDAGGAALIATAGETRS
ncbi:hypothetical protein MKI84_12615 [Ancylobacter sp. A5.8]|uniref:hypothetical protein n=1 Tax=Ancylobacter gelatini TaxID=2919920 RepID=UPI001F4E2312|nr:hypothetical protein [Ancylobacter gelatini]MCJ8143759.1 hypothetical protein [Ancylobacter gelatini]